jgi:2,3-bisphosphoglycerate-independent phosphoglycerate mutase
MTGEVVAPGDAPGARPRPLVLVVVDGFGIGPDPSVDAIAQASMPRWRGLMAEWPHTALEASGLAVGLPEGQMGNSEVGHLNIGAGRPVLQDLPRIDAAIADGSFTANRALRDAVERAASRGSRLHLLSLVGPGGVHAVDRHLVAVAAMANEAGVADVAVHALLDGRDTPPRSAVAFLPNLEERLLGAHPGARIALIGGRYYGMDRDKRWDRVARWWEAMVHGQGLTALTVSDALSAGYARGENDEFVQPTVIGDGAPVRDGDVVIHCNFRADRARELTHALVDGDGFGGFDRGARPKDLHVVTMTEYQEGLPVSAVAFPPEVVTSLAEVVSAQGWRQFHVAETEKYAHVTYFLNGGAETAWPGEERLLVPSPKVATYDLEPHMSAAGITDALVAAIESGAHDVIMANYANPDMVGHTGVWDATVEACTFLDGCLGRVADAVLAVDAASVAVGGPGALLVVTADHGNADVMRDPAGNVVTAHSLSLVPLLLAGTLAHGLRLRRGVLADVTPTILGFLGLPLAPGMSGASLVEDPG